MSGSDKRSTSGDLNPSSLKRVRMTPLSEFDFIELIDRAVDSVEGSSEQHLVLARAARLFNPFADDINRLVDGDGTSVLWLASRFAKKGEPALLKKIIAGWDDLGVKLNVNLTPLSDYYRSKGASVLLLACDLAKAGKPALLGKIIDVWDQLEPKPNLNLAPLYDGHQSRGISVFWCACLLAKTGKTALLDKIIAKWDELDPKPNLNLAPLHDDYRSKGVSVFWFACALAQRNKPELLEKIIAKWDQLDPRPSLNLAPLNDCHQLQGTTVFRFACDLDYAKKPALFEKVIASWDELEPKPDLNLAPLRDDSLFKGVSMLWEACSLAMRDRPALLNNIITNWDDFEVKPNVNLMPLNNANVFNGVSVFWYGCLLARRGNSALLEKIIASWDQLDPKPNLNLAPLHDDYSLKGVTVFDMAVSMSVEGRPDLLNCLLSNWFSLEPRVNLESCQKEKLPAGLHATLVGLDRIKVIIETDVPSEAEKDELSSLIDQFAKFMCSDSPYKKPLVEGFVEYLSSQGQRGIRAAFVSDLGELNYPIFPSLALESVMTSTVKTDFVIQDALRKAVAAYLSLSVAGVDDESTKHIFREKIKRLRLKLAGSRSLVALPKAYNEEFDEFLQAQDEHITSTDYLERLNAMMISAQDVSILKRLVARELSKAVADGAGAAAGSGAGAGSSTPFRPRGDEAEAETAIYLTCQENKL